MASIQILFLNPTQTILVDVLAWLIIHLTIGYCCSKISVDWLNTEQSCFQTFEWEKDGEIYEKFFHVRAWKCFIPNGSKLYHGAFSIKNLLTYELAYLERWLKESVRAEICHWLMILPGFFFFIWNSMALAWVNVAYAFLNNLVLIILQRYKRPRMCKLLAQIERKLIKKGIPYVHQKELSHSYL